MRLPLRTRVLYAASSLGGEAATQSRGLWLVAFYAPPPESGREELLPLAVVGALITAARLVEAIDDPLVGWWSDRTRSRLGRRLPFVLGATPLWALFGFLLFTPPEGGTVATAAYLFVVLELFFLFSTLAGGPYEALLPELATTSADRVSIVSIRVLMGAVGAAVGVVASGPLIDLVDFHGMALVVAALALVTRYAGMIGVWRQASRDVPPTALRFRETLRMTFESAGFVAFLPSFVLFQTALQLLLGSVPFLVVATISPDDEELWTSVVTGAAFGTTLAVVPLFARYARRTSKRQAYSRAMLGAGLAFPLVALAGFLPGIDPTVQVVAVFGVAGAPIAGVFLFPSALTADICDDDVLRTGLRREAMFYGAQNLVEKTVTSVAPFLLAGLLLLGRTEDDPLGLRLAGPAAGLLVVVGWWLFRRYDLPDEPGAGARASAAPGGGGAG